MKKTLMTMVALMAVTVAVAQPGDKKDGRQAPPQPTPEEVTERMSKELGLTDAQKKKVAALNKDYKDVLGGPGAGRGPRGPRPERRVDGQTEATQQQPGHQPDAQRRGQRPQTTEEQRADMQKRMEKRQEYDGKLKKILTDDQFKTYQSRHQHRGRTVKARQGRKQ